MIHIEKKGLPQNVEEKIIRLSKSNEWKSVPDDDATAIRHFFNDVFPKEDVKRVLVHEQHGICAYCMRRIHEDAHTRVEHIYPLSKDKQKAIKYSNMLAVCDGGEKTPGIQSRVLCCDANKKDTEIFLNPLNKDQMRKLLTNGMAPFTPSQETKKWRRISMMFCG